jgi:hypothetical protein
MKRNREITGSLLKRTRTGFGLDPGTEHVDLDTNLESRYIFRIEKMTLKNHVLESWMFSVREGLELLCTLFNTASSAAPQISTVSEDAGIDPRTVATSALTARRSKRSARSHPQG